MTIYTASDGKKLESYEQLIEHEKELRINKIREEEIELERSFSCPECYLDLEDETDARCKNCNSMLFDRADHYTGEKIIIVSTKETHYHFCCKQCAENFVQELKQC